MILIFGGTTEGREAVDVCEQAGTPFYYSTKSDTQEVELVNGVRLCGPMTAKDITEFCQEKGIKCLIDAAHPFAENLHQTLAEVGLPVIRLQRDFGQPITGVTYCDDYNDAIAKMETQGVNKLMALTGTNTIGKLKPFWQRHETYFRILNRPDSKAIAQQHGFDPQHLLFFNDQLALPNTAEEKQLMEGSSCDAMLTKESGASGGYQAKVTAALSLGLKVFVVKHPQLPSHWTYVSGKVGLRRAIEHTVPDYFKLKTGFTTGACATAATKAALISLLYGEQPDEINFALPNGEIMSIEVHVEHKGTAWVTKDFSDDPDVTRGCKITAQVALNESGEVTFKRGAGVGVVTLPGLGIPVGGPAINPTPRKMITNEIRQLTQQGCDVTIAVENGEEIAKKTFNPKVGVEGGISIIGTSGIVYPLSNEAFVQSIRREMNVAKAIGCKTIALVSGKKGEDAIRKQYDIRCIHYGNLIGEALKSAYEMGFEKVVIGIMIGKAVKLAEGHLNTHSHKVQMNKDFLKSIAGQEAYQIDHITMARELWKCMSPDFFEKIRQRCHQTCRTVFPDRELETQLICDENLS